MIGDTVIGDGVYLEGAIVSYRCRIGSWARVEGLTVLAEDVVVKEEVRVTECMVLSHKSIN